MKWTLEENKITSSFRDAYVNTLSDLIEKDGDVMVLDADLMKSSGADVLLEKYPDNCVNFGISEANMVSAAGGMSKAGIIPFAHSFAPFITRRTLDQIYMSIAYSGNSLFIYSSDAGIWSQRNGGTHTANEDMAVMRAIPGCKVFDPSDPIQFKWVMKQYHQEKGLYYARAGRKNEIPHIYTEDSGFEVGKACVLRKGDSKVAIVASGMMVHEALAAAQTLEEKGISPAVIDMLSIKPYDEALLQALIASKDLIVAAENHSLIGGLGSIVGYEIAKSSANPKFKHIAIGDSFGEVGSLEFLKNKFKLNASDIVASVLDDK